MNEILFLGGDRRVSVAIEYMKNQGFIPVCYAHTHRSAPIGVSPSAVVLPLPVLRNGRLNAPLLSDPPTPEQALRETKTDPRVCPAFGGPWKDHPFAQYTDLTALESFKKRNAVTTAEGALELLIRHTDRAIFGARILILGYGAIATRLADLLKAMGARVTVAARKPQDRVDASLHGYGVQDTAQLHLDEADVVVNTVPAPLITPKMLAHAPERLLYLELASAPGACCEQDVVQSGRTYVHGGALPGKVAPITAGEDLAKTLIEALSSPQQKGSGAPLGT